LSYCKHVSTFEATRPLKRRAGLLLLAALLAAPAIAPHMAVAQNAGTSTTFPEKATPNAKADVKTEEEQTEAFRHSPTVQWVAKTLNVPLETTAKSLELINFAILALAIGIPLFKVLPRIIRKRSETLSKDLETARVATTDANTRLSAVEERLSGLDAEIASIRKQVEDEIVGDEARIKATIEEESARIVAAAEQEIGVAAAQAQRELKQFAADLAIDRALAQLRLTPENESALIAEFAKDSATEMHGGVN
jgi:F-type H+-transporting ATPase subunit b